MCRDRHTHRTTSWTNLIADIARRYRMTLDSVQRVCSELLLVLRSEDGVLFQGLASADPQLERLLETRTLRAYPRGRFGADTGDAAPTEARPPGLSGLALRQMLRLAGVPPRGIGRMVGEFVAWLGSLFDDIDDRYIKDRSPSLCALAG